MKWLKKKKRTLPEEKICRNCGAETHGRYCYECGQDVLAGSEQPIVNLAGQVLENAFALDAQVCIQNDYQTLKSYLLYLV